MDRLPPLAHAGDLRGLGDRVLVVAPHPDDETLAVAGTIAALRAAGAAVRVVYLSDGDGYRRAAAALRRHHVPPTRRLFSRLATEDYRRLGETRVTEALAALARIGVDEADATFLAYPDGILGAPGRRARNGRTRVREGGFRPGAAYSREGLVADLAAVIAAFAPTAVLHPHHADTNPDHRAAARLVADAVPASGAPCARLAYLAHRYTYPWVRPRAWGLRPPAFLASSGRWERRTITPDALAAKTRSLAAHRTQLAVPDLALFARAFLRDDEWLERMP